MPGAGFLDAAISSSIMVLIPTSSCTESTRLDAPSSSCTTATKLNCLQSPLFPLDRGGYGKIGDCEQCTTKHDTPQISSFILFHCIKPKRFLGFSTQRHKGRFTVTMIPCAATTAENLKKRVGMKQPVHMGAHGKEADE